IATGCEQAGCALIGGETAEMPGMYPDGEYDLAGFAVGVVEKSEILDASKVKEGDAIIGLASNGAHSNGYSLVRKILERAQPDLSQPCDGVTLKEAIMAPTRMYVKPVLKLIKALPVHALAHITGGGLVENIPRVLPEQLTAELDRAAWPESDLFKWLQANGQVPFDEMNRVFNCGIGMVVVLPADQVDAAMALLKAEGETPYLIGRVRQRQQGEAHTIVTPASV
ncbi:MAG TPA: phosphoribosylformylglycinamidine cyclo-ligase, partial [Limnobacter sp.]|nr:phosphoribosylformylglycinamidine cyclo-ligase [Limnobacter sp.]